MTLQQLLYFRTAANLGSFNAAARALHCTQPAVSDQVRRLERELGVSLFARAGRGLTLTTAGRTFLTRAERVAEAADDALASVGHGHTAREQEVNLGTFRNAPYYGIAGLAARFCMAHPEVRLRLRGQNSFDVARAVQDGELEAGLVVLPVDDSLLDVRALFRDEVVVTLTRSRARDRWHHRGGRHAADPLRPQLRIQRSDPPPARRPRTAGGRGDRATDRGRARGDRAATGRAGLGARSPPGPCWPAFRRMPGSGRTASSSRSTTSSR